MADVTVGGGNLQTITLSFDTTSNVALAQQIAAQISADASAGKVVLASDLDAPVVPPGSVGVFLQSGQGPVTLPPGFTTDIVQTAGNAAVFGNGSTGEAILSGAPTNLTFIETGGSGSVVA